MCVHKQVEENPKAESQYGNVNVFHSQVENDLSILVGADYVHAGYLGNESNCQHMI
jgi:hypothetical protein